MKKKILIIGAEGFVGSNLAYNLNDKDNFQIYLMDLVKREKLKNLKLNKLKNCKYIKCNIQNKNEIQKFKFYNFDYIFHLASLVGVEKVTNTAETINSIIIGTQNVISYLVKKNSKLIFASTSEVYGNNPNLPWNEKDQMLVGTYDSPRWNYAKCKSIMENYIMEASYEKKFKFLVLRFFNVYGPRQSKYFLIPKIIKNCKKNLICKIYYPGNQSRCFTYIDDVIYFLYKACSKNIRFNEIINIGSNKKSKVKDVIKLIVKITKSKSKIKLYKLNRIKNSKFKDVINRQPDINKIKKLYNWKPSTNLLQGLKKTIFYLDNN